MKKIILSAAAVIALVSTSCTKDHTCTCTTIPASSGGTQPPTFTTATVYHKSTMANATLYCEGQATQVTTTVGSTSTAGDNTTCTIK